MAVRESRSRADSHKNVFSSATVNSARSMNAANLRTTETHSEVASLLKKVRVNLDDRESLNAAINSSLSGISSRFIVSPIVHAQPSWQSPCDAWRSTSL